MINKVTLIGFTGSETATKELENGNKVAKISLATNENYKDKSGEWQTKTEWHGVIFWGNLAERAAKQIEKGSMVYVEGKLTHRKYQDKEGIERNITEVVAATFRLLDKKEQKQEQESSPARDALMESDKDEITADTTGEQADDLPF